ncbi:MAG: hypothetical protein KOO62_11645 [candidate division Zixibacteria bacterium]|nr:hypothetical protein [candidate division Zixibacteria bacterium]
MLLVLTAMAFNARTYWYLGQEGVSAIFEGLVRTFNCRTFRPLLIVPIFVGLFELLMWVIP